MSLRADLLAASREAVQQVETSYATSERLVLLGARLALEATLRSQSLAIAPGGPDCMVSTEDIRGLLQQVSV